MSNIGQRQGLISAYRRIMTPLVRILLKNGVSYGEFAEVLKNVFVEVAERDLSMPGRRPSQARVAIITGLTRKEVAKQKATIERGDLVEASNLNRVTRVLEAWHTDPEYTGAYGLPIELPFENAGNRPSFNTLVRKHSGDMAPRAMLDELLRINAAEMLPSGQIRVLMRAYIPQSLHPDALERLGTVVKNFVTTYEYNMEHNADGAARFERVVYADNGLSLELLAAFDRLIRVKGFQLLVELDNWLGSQTKPEDSPVSGERVNTGVGIYHFIEEPD
jgi:Family of unknown function (DUF6502)